LCLSPDIKGECNKKAQEMKKRDIGADGALIVGSDVWLALGLLSRLPLPTPPDLARSSRASWAYPIVGLVVGGLAALVALVAQALSIPTAMTAVLILTTLIVVTGAMHEDGLADTADGLWGGWDSARRLEIMKDSHIGAYGVIALILALLARWTLLVTLLATSSPALAILGVAAVSRAPMVAVMAALPHARAEGLSRSVGRPDQRTALVAAGIAAVLALLIWGVLGLWICAVAYGAALGMGLIARAKIAGQTGDILGATQQIAEIAALTALAAILS
jgi:adenosylcobinamide-GDP ribazoletransferase